MLRIPLLVQPRTWFAALCCALLLAACGGGGGDPGDGGGTVQPDNPPLQGDWQLTLAIAGGASTAAVDVAVEDIPLSASDLDLADVAEIIAATRFQAYNTVVSGSTLRVTDDNTDYFMAINSVTVSDFDGCGSCGPGTEILLDLTVHFSEEGVFEGGAVPERSTTVLLTLRYTRAR